MGVLLPTSHNKMTAIEMLDHHRLARFSSDLLPRIRHQFLMCWEHATAHENVYITSVLRYRPPKNRDPKPSEIGAVQPFLDEQIKIIKPKVIATLGRYSLKKFLLDAKIAQVHGQPQKIKWNGLNLTIIPLYHPAAVIYNRSLQKTLEEDFQTIRKVLKIK